MKRVARFLVSKIRPSQEILKIRDGTPLEAEEEKRKKRVARFLVSKIRPSQEILKIRDGTPLQAEEILTHRKGPQNGSVWHFSSKLDVPSNVLHKKRVAQILVFKIRPSQEILKIRDDTPSENKRVAWILVFKIRPSQEILKLRDGTTLEPEEILTHKKSPRNGSVWHFSSKLDVPSNVLQKKRVARILFFKIWPSHEILKIRDGTPLEKKRVARFLVSKIRPSQEILKIRDGTPLEAEEVAGILVFKIRPSQEILKLRDGTTLEPEEILTHKKSPRNGSVWHFSSKLDVPNNVLQKKRVARILFFKIWPSHEILKIRDVAGILVFKISPSQEILKIRDATPSRVARFLVSKIRPSQEILKIRDGTPLEAEEVKKRVARFLVSKIRPSQEILKIRDVKRVARFLVSKIRPSQEILKIRDVARFLVSKIRPSQEILKIRDVARILVFKIRPSQEILKLRDGTTLEPEEILTHKKSPRNGSVWHFSSKLDVPNNVLQKKRVARILFFKIWPSHEILKIRDGILVFKISPSQEILKIRDATPSRGGRNFNTQKKALEMDRVARFLVSKIRPSQEILKIRDGTPLEAEEVKKRVARFLVSKIRPSQEILKIRDGTPLQAEEILTHRKGPQNGSVWHFSSKLDVPSNVLHKKRVAQILVFKIRPSQEILKIRDGTPSEMPSQEILKLRDGTTLEPEEILTHKKALEMDRVAGILKKRVARFLVSKIRPSQEILKIRDGTPLEAEEGLTHRKNPQNGSVWYFSSKLDVPSNVLQKKRVAGILVFKIRPSQEILKLRDGTTLEPGEILTHKKSPRNGSVWHFSSKLDVPSNVLQKKRVARILFFKIWPSHEILKIRDGTPLE
ncbi:hypothetical protein OROMI_013760 [Orobanche minor]